MGGIAQKQGAFSFTFVNQTGSSAGKKTDEEDLSIIRSHAMRTVHHKRRTSPRNTTPHPIPKSSLSVDYDQQALCQFFENFVYPQQTTKVNAFQYLDFLPSIYKQDAHNDHLTNAVLAVALAHFANLRGIDDLHSRARQSYARSLNRVNKSLAKPTQMASDEILATLCLLTKYECVTGNEGYSWRLHEKGQAAMINHRGKEQLQTETGASLFRLIWIRSHLNGIANSELPPDQSLFDWADAFPSICVKQLMHLVSRLTTIRDESRQVLSKCSTIEEEARIYQKAKSLDRDMQNFIDSLPPEVQHWTVPSAEAMSPSSPASDNSSYFPENIHLFEDLQRASIWHIYLFCQIYLLQTMLQHTQSLDAYGSYAVQPVQKEFSVQNMSSDGNLSAQHLRLRLRLAIDDVCASVPFLLGWSDNPTFLNSERRGRAVACHYSIWALAAILSIHEIDIPEAQTEWVRDRLRDIGLVRGVRLALVLG